MATVCAHQDGEEDGNGFPSASSRTEREDVDIFSLSWYNKTEIAPYFPDNLMSRSEQRQPLGPHFKVRLILELVAHNHDSFGVKWLEVTKPHANANGEMAKNTDCLYKCPELNACISPDLWCDGKQDCPSGFDE